MFNIHLYLNKLLLDSGHYMFKGLLSHKVLYYIAVNLFKVETLHVVELLF